MNVCVISREFPPFFGGGIGAYATRFTRALAAHGHRPVVITVSEDGHEHRESDGAITIVRLPFIRGRDWSRPDPAVDSPEHRAAFAAFHPVSVFAMQVARVLPRLVDEFAIDVIEAPDTGALAWFALNERRLGRPWSSQRRPPLVTVVHSPTAWISELNHDPLSDPRDRALVAMEGESLAWSDGLICPSAAVARWTERLVGLPTGAVHVVPNPLGDLEPAAVSAAAGKLALPEWSAPRRVFFSGRLEPRKGADTLLRGFAAAVSAGADLALDLVGRDTTDPRTGTNLGASVINSMDSELRERVRLHGQRPPDEVAKLRRAAHMAVLPSPVDNFPYSCVEAMADGRVVIASRAGGMAEMIRDGVDGLLFEPGRHDACADALRRAAAMTPEQALAMGRSAAARILELCGNERVVSMRLAHYKMAALAAAPAMERPVVLVNPDGESERLRQDAACAGRPDFVHGWVRQAGQVIALGTPSARSLECSGPPLGPLAVSAHALDDPRIGPLVRRLGGVGSTRSTRRLAAALARAGYVGAVDPGVVSVVPRPGLLARALRGLSRAPR